MASALEFLQGFTHPLLQALTDPQRQAALDVAALEIDASEYGERSELALALMAAHTTIMDKQGSSGGANLKSRQIGKRKVEFFKDGNYSGTTFGARLDKLPKEPSLGAWNSMWGCRD